MGHSVKKREKEPSYKQVRINKQPNLLKVCIWF